MSSVRRQRLRRRQERQHAPYIVCTAMTVVASQISNVLQTALQAVVVRLCNFSGNSHYCSSFLLSRSHVVDCHIVCLLLLHPHPIHAFANVRCPNNEHVSDEVAEDECCVTTVHCIYFANDVSTTLQLTLLLHCAPLIFSCSNRTFACTLPRSAASLNF